MAALVALGTAAVAIASNAPWAHAATARAPHELKAAITSLGQFHSDLFRGNRPIVVRRRVLRPELVRHFQPDDLGGAIWSHVWDGLVPDSLVERKLELGDLPAFGGLEPFGAELDVLGPADFAERLINSAALLEGGFQRKTDALFRPTVFGWSVYFQIRSRSAPEVIEVEGPVCEASEGDSEYRAYFAHLGRAGIAVLIRRHSPPCSAGYGDPHFFLMQLPATPPITAADTAANYRHELHLLRAAERLARREHAALLSLVDLSAARDAAGKTVPTNREGGLGEGGAEIVIRHRERRYRYPILMHLLFIRPPR